MAPKNKSETKFSYKGNIKAENKYSNIYEDLVEKESSYVSNSLKKNNADNTDVDSEPKSVEEKFNIKHVSPEEAKENAIKRKKHMKNERIIATQKSNPVIEHKKRLESGSIDDIERLKREKKNSKLSDLEHFDKVYEDDLSSGLEDDSVLNNPKIIREEAKRRVHMDKSNVEIFKEYSDFESFNKFNEDNASTFDNLGSDDKRYIDNSVDEKTNVFDFDDLYKGENLTKEEKIKKRENEIEELIRLMKQDSDRGSRNKTRKEKQKNVKEESDSIYISDAEIINNTSKNKKSTKELTDFRSDVYRRNSNKNIQRINYKKIAVTLIILILVGLFVAAGIDKFLTDLKKNSVTTTEPAKTKEKSKKEDDKVQVSQNSQERVGKLKAIQSKLNVEESERLNYILENMSTYPNEMLDLLIRNPETIDFVYSYKDKDKYNNKQLSENITSSYYVDGSVPLFLQWDRRWGYRKYGNELTGLAGCGPTSLAMVVRHFDRESGINPYDVAKYSSENGYLSKDNFTSWNLFENGLTKYGLESRDIIPVEAKMKKALDNGKILIASVKPGMFTERGHIIVIKGYNKDGDFLINDPNSIINTNKSWSFDELKNEIRKIWGVGKVNSGDNSNENNKEKSNDEETSSGLLDNPSIIQDIN